jgi:hypothetical protein
LTRRKKKLGKKKGRTYHVCRPCDLICSVFAKGHFKLKAPKQKSDFEALKKKMIA